MRLSFGKPVLSLAEGIGTNGKTLKRLSLSGKRTACILRFHAVDAANSARYYAIISKIFGRRAARAND
jgi:hypothetical protein